MKTKLPDLTSYEAVIFDLDGTLYDSMGMWGQIDVDYLARYGIDKPPDLQQCLAGLSFQETSYYFKERFGLQDDPETIQADWLQMAEEAYNHTLPLKSGAGEILAYLKENGIPAAIASSNHADLIARSFEFRGLTPYFSALITCDDVKANKPDPAVYLMAAEKLGVLPERCLVFEDIVPGILAGRNAGMTVCAVDDHDSPQEAMAKRQAADAYITDYRELIPV